MWALAHMTQRSKCWRNISLSGGKCILRKLSCSFGTQSRNLGYSYNDSLVKAPKNFVTKVLPLHQDSVGLKLPLAVKHPHLADGHNPHLWEWWLRPLPLELADLGRPQVEQLQIDGTRNLVPLPWLKAWCRLQYKVTTLWWHLWLEWMGPKCQAHTGKKIYLIGTSRWPTKNSMLWFLLLAMR